MNKKNKKRETGMKIKILISTCFFLLILISSNISALDVPLEVYEALRQSGTGIDRINEPVSVGIPLPENSGINSINQLGLSGASVAQFRPLAYYKNGNIKWVLIDTQVSLLANGANKNLVLTDGSGNFGGSNLATEDSNYIYVNTGTAQFTIKKKGFNLFDKVVVNGQQLINPGESIGVRIIDLNNTEYLASNDESVKVVIEENGPVKSVVKAEGTHYSLTGKRMMDFTFRIYFYKDKSKVRVNYVLRNAGKNQLENGKIKSLDLITKLNIGPNKNLKTITYNSSINEIVDSSDSFAFFQSYTTTPEEFVPSNGWFLSSSLGVPCWYPSFSGDCPNAGYVIKKNNKTISSGSKSQYHDLYYLDLSDSSGKGATAGIRFGTVYWPKALRAKGDNTIEVGLYPDENDELNTSWQWYEDWSSYNLSGYRIFYGTHSTYDVMYDFHSSSNNPSDEMKKFQYRLFARAPVNWYNLNVNGIDPLYHFVSRSEEKNYALNNNWTYFIEKRDANEVSFMRYHDWGTSALWNQHDQARISLVNAWKNDKDNLSGVSYLYAEQLFNYNNDISIRHSDDYDYESGICYGTFCPSNEIAYGRKYIFETEHFHWYGLPLYYYATGEERIKDSVNDWGEYVKSLSRNLNFNFMRVVGWNFYSLAAMYDFTGDKEFMTIADNNFKTLLKGTYYGLSLNWERGYVAGGTGSSAYAVKPFMHSYIMYDGLLNYYNHLNETNSLRKSAKNLLDAMSDFTKNELIFADNNGSFTKIYLPYLYYTNDGSYAAAMGIKEVHNSYTQPYLFNGGQEWIDLMKQSYRTTVYEGYGYADHPGFQKMAYTLTHPRADITPSNAINDLSASSTGNSIELSWTEPADVSKYEVKYSNKKIIYSLAFNKMFLNFTYPSSEYSNWLTSNNTANDPIPVSAGNKIKFTVNNLQSGNYYFAVSSWDGSNNRADISNLAHISFNLKSCSDSGGNIICQSGYICNGTSITANDTQLGQTCCIGDCIQPLSLPSCLSQGGVSCQTGETCSTGSFVAANDTNKCCIGICQSQIQPCTLTNAYWSKTSATEGDTVTLTAIGDNCDSESINFIVKEDDLFSGDDYPVTPPSSSVFSSGKATATWTAEYQPDGALGINDPPEYYFTATLASNNSISIDSKNNNLLSVNEYIPSCLEKGGKVCLSYQTCEGAITDASDTNQCCIGNCLNITSSSGVYRSFSSENLNSDEILTVTIDVLISNNESYYIIDEVIPDGFTIINSGTGNTQEAGHIKWVVIQGAKSTTYTYTVRAPLSTDKDTTYSFNGMYILEFMSRSKAITGSKDVTVVTSPTTCTDSDGDGFNQSKTGCGIADCDDSDINKWQLLNGYVDNDNDNYGGGGALQSICSGLSLPLGYSYNSLDCNDNNSTINPSATEICGNNIDEDCNGADEKCSIITDNDNDTIIDDLDCNDNSVLIGECISCNICNITTIGIENGVCVFGIPKPVMYKYENLITTNLTNKNLLNNISNFTIGIPNLLKIEFIEEVSLFRNVSGTCKKLNFDSYINISAEKIDIRSEYLPELNQSAVITMYNVKLTNPFILRDGIKCDECEIIIYENNTLIFKVLHFSKYSVAGIPPVTGEVVYEVRGGCGDGICDSAAGEICGATDNAPECNTDCSTCPAPSGGGGSSGGGGGAPPYKNFSLSIDDVSFKLSQGESKSVSFSITNTGDSSSNFDINSNLEEISFSENIFSLAKGGSKTINANVNIGENKYYGIYVGKIYVKSGSMTKEISVSIEVVSADSLFDVVLIIPDEYLSVPPGENILGEVTLTRLGGLSGISRVTLNYIIEDEHGNILLSESEQKDIEETSTNINKEFIISKDEEYGKYVLYVQVIYEGKVASASKWFNVGTKSKLVGVMFWFVVVVVILIISIAFVILVIYLKDIKKDYKIIKKDS